MAAMEEPKRPYSAYELYVQATRQAVQKDIGCKAFCQVARVQAERWKNIPAAAKEEYKQQAAELKAKHEKDVAAFKKAGGVVGERRKIKKRAEQTKAENAAKKKTKAGRPKKLAGGAYTVYLRQHHAEIAKSLPAGYKWTDVVRAAGKQWKLLSAAAKE